MKINGNQSKSMKSMKPMEIYEKTMKIHENQRKSMKIDRKR